MARPWLIERPIFSTLYLQNGRNRFIYVSSVVYHTAEHSQLNLSQTPNATLHLRTITSAPLHILGAHSTCRFPNFSNPHSIDTLRSLSCPQHPLHIRHPFSRFYNPQIWPGKHFRSYLFPTSDPYRCPFHPPGLAPTQCHAHRIRPNPAPSSRLSRRKMSILHLRAWRADALSLLYLGWAKHILLLCSSFPALAAFPPPVCSRTGHLIRFGRKIWFQMEDERACNRCRTCPIWMLLCRHTWFKSERAGHTPRRSWPFPLAHAHCARYHDCHHRRWISICSLGGLHKSDLRCAAKSIRKDGCLAESAWERASPSGSLGSGKECDREGRGIEETGRGILA